MDLFTTVIPLVSVFVFGVVIGYIIRDRRKTETSTTPTLDECIAAGESPPHVRTRETEGVWSAWNK